jgi:hypothetical protein
MILKYTGIQGPGGERYTVCTTTPLLCNLCHSFKGIVCSVMRGYIAAACGKFKGTVSSDVNEVKGTVRSVGRGIL